jgi:site-specific DNA recombinase
MTTCAVYARKSNAEAGDKAADRKSTAVQLAECREFAKARGWRVVREFVDDGISGAEMRDRPGLASLIEAVEGQSLPFDVLLVTERSRIARESIDGLALLKRLLDSGLTMWETGGRGEQITLESASDKIREFMHLFAADMERGKGSERSRRVKAQAAKAGRATGKRLFGYTPGFEIVPEQANVVRRVFTLRASGLGVYRIARQLERENILTPSGKRVWNVSQVAAITHNTAYMGERQWGREKRVYKRGHVRIVKADPSQIITSKVPAIIDADLWARVQEINNAAEAACWRNDQGHLKARPTAKAEHLLNPFLQCGVCGGGMHAKLSGTKFRYVCTRRHQKGPLACSNRYGMSQDGADAEVLNKFKHGLVESLVLNLMREAIDEHKRRSQDPEPLKKEQAKLEKEISNLVEACASGAIPDIKKAIDSRRARLEHLDGMIKGAGVADSFDLEEFAGRVLPVIRDWRNQLTKNTSTAQQALRKLLPEKITATRQDNGTWTFKVKPDFSALIREVGMVGDAMSAILQEVKVTRTRARRGSRRGP